MNCQETKDNLASFLSGGLKAGEVENLLEHLSHCSACKHELQDYEAMWKALGAWTDLDPDSGYVPRFWMRLSAETHWYERILVGLKPFILPSRLVPFFVALVAAIILLQGSLSQRRIREMESVLTSLTRDDIEFMENMDLVESMDVLEDVEFLKDFDVITAMAEKEG